MIVGLRRKGGGVSVSSGCCSSITLQVIVREQAFDSIAQAHSINLLLESFYGRPHRQVTENNVLQWCQLRTLGISRCERCAAVDGTFKHERDLQQTRKGAHLIEERFMHKERAAGDSRRQQMAAVRSRLDSFVLVPVHLLPRMSGARRSSLARRCTVQRRQS